jgi:importin-4
LKRREEDHTLTTRSSTVTDINRSLAIAFKTAGPAPLITSKGPVVVQLTQILVNILSKKHACQQDFEGELDEADLQEESSEYDWLVIDTALDTIAGLAAALGPSFAELWKVFQKPIFKYAGSQEGIERTAAVGTIAECIPAMAAAVADHTDMLLTVLLRRLSDEDPEVKSNAAYAVGLLVEHSPDEAKVLASLLSVFQKLEPMLAEGGEARIRDNAAGCVARVVLRYPGRVPLEQVLPSLIEALPLREDYEENKPVYDMVVKLCEFSPLFCLADPGMVYCLCAA